MNIQKKVAVNYVIVFYACLKKLCFHIFISIILINSIVDLQAFLQTSLKYHNEFSWKICNLIL